ncbi:hypothetical protein [Cupriavidus metallidurans]|uniref:hypothetical protein n=1 Tax=Cupriavidus metallidurans TaxID=119219 RepID=UPI001CCAA367|nr:hypothetical protein [Cupriavidus metallidurans]UBM12779.1 hypothetical protein LAI70_27895 [Cupriavidus metallidurans]
MANIDKVCTELGARLGVRVSRSEFLRLCAGAAASDTFSDRTLSLLVEVATEARRTLEAARAAAETVKSSLIDLTPEQLAQLSTHIEQMRTRE